MFPTINSPKSKLWKAWKILAREERRHTINQMYGFRKATSFIRPISSFLNYKWYTRSSLSSFCSSYVLLLFSRLLFNYHHPMAPTPTLFLLPSYPTGSHSLLLSYFQLLPNYNLPVVAQSVFIKLIKNFDASVTSWNEALITQPESSWPTC